MNIVYLRNVPYDRNNHLTERPTRIVSASIVYKSRIWAGRRHCDLIQQIVADLNVNPDGRPTDSDGDIIIVTQDMQGFLCDTGLHTARIPALSICLRYGQLPRDFKHKILLSEYLW